MKYKYSFLGLAAGTALLVAAGCGKQEPAATPSVDNATKAPAPVAAAKPQPAENPKPAVTQPAVSADKPAAVATKPESTTPATPATPAPVTPTPAALTLPPSLASATNTAVNQPATAALNAAVVSNAVASVLSSNTASVSAGARAQQMSFSQNVTNQLQALVAAATNQALSTLGTTNLAASTTNQVQALLDRAKTLCANQKYQDALSNVTQLYTYKLTSDQKQKADDLAAQIKTGIAQKATSALGSFLGGGSK